MSSRSRMNSRSLNVRTQLSSLTRTAVWSRWYGPLSAPDRQRAAAAAAEACRGIAGQPECQARSLAGRGPAPPGAPLARPGGLRLGTLRLAGRLTGTQAGPRAARGRD
jgi:hypothetical protein